MSKKKIRLILISFTCIGVLCFTVPLRNFITTSKINSDVIDYVNSIDFLNTDISNYLLDKNIISPKTASSPSKIEENYSVQINRLYECNISEEYIENKPYYTYSFVADISAYKDNKIITQFNMPSEIILAKDKNRYSIKSLLGFKEDILKSLKDSPQPKDDEIVSAIALSSLTYSNDDIGFQVNYPEDYTYVSNTLGTSIEKCNYDVVSFYSEEDKNSNYIKLEVNNEENTNAEKSINDLLDKGYNVIESNYTSESNLSYTILSQTFKKQNKDFSEVVYILNEPISNLNQIRLSLNFETEKLEKNKNEIQSVISSLKSRT